MEDAVCPSHVFPFGEGRQLIAHTNFEKYASDVYRERPWPLAVESAPGKLILNYHHLRQAVETAADCVYTLPCVYLAQNGKLIGGDWVLNGYSMSDDDIGICMKKAASLIKGAAMYTRTPDANLPSLAIAVDAPDGYENWIAGNTETIRWAYVGNRVHM